jgi:hypothetical protein
MVITHVDDAHYLENITRNCAEPGSILPDCTVEQIASLVPLLNDKMRVSPHCTVRRLLTSACESSVSDLNWRLFGRQVGYSGLETSTKYYQIITGRRKTRLRNAPEFYGPEQVYRPSAIDDHFISRNPSRRLDDAQLILPHGPYRTRHAPK